MDRCAPCFVTASDAAASAYETSRAFVLPGAQPRGERAAECIPRGGGIHNAHFGTGDPNPFPSFTVQAALPAQRDDERFHLAAKRVYGLFKIFSAAQFRPFPVSLGTR